MKHPYGSPHPRYHALQATFGNWKVKTPGAIIAVIPGLFTVKVRLIPDGQLYRYHAHIGTMLNEFSETFAESKLEDCKRYIESQFEAKVEDWKEIESR
jgi:hypothetical protein